MICIKNSNQKIQGERSCYETKHDFIDEKCQIVKFLMDFDFFEQNVSIAGAFEFVRPVYFITDPKLAKQLAVKDFEYFLDRRQLINGDIDPLFGKSIVNLKGQRWKSKNLSFPNYFKGQNNCHHCRYANNTIANVHRLENENDVYTCVNGWQTND